MQIKAMKKLFTKRLSMLLAFLLTFVLFFGMFTDGNITAWAKQKKSEDINNILTLSKQTSQGIYVAFGDSVPAGYGLSDPNTCYVKRFSDKLKESGHPNSMTNYAISGITTDKLLTGFMNMQSTNPDAMKTMKNASIITVNIGGNNVLGPLVEAVNTNLEQQLKTQGITSIANATSDQLSTIGLSLFTMTLDDTHMAQIQKGAQNFANDFPKIIEWLKTSAPNANIIVSTIYNPIPSYLSFYKTADTMLKDMNAVITKSAPQSGYYVADIYSAFVKEQTLGTQIINLNLGQYKATPLSIDIHPNIAGHELIANIHNDIFKTIPTIIKTNPKTPVTSLLPLSGKVSNKTLSADITEQSLTSAIEKAQSEAKRLGREKDGIAVIYKNGNSNVKGMIVTFEEKAIDLLKSKGVKGITIYTDNFCFGLDKAAIQMIQKKTDGNVTVNATPVTKLSKVAKKLIGSRPVYKIKIEDDNGKTITDLGKGKISINLCYNAPSNEKKGSLHVIYLNKKGKLELLTDSIFTDGWVSCTSNLLSTYGIGLKK